MDEIIWVYYSQTVEDFWKQNVEQIVSDWRNANQTHGVTGMLLFRNGNFTQALEGKKDKILSLKANILRDPRHQNVNTLYQGPYPRMFARWSLAYLHPDAHQQRQIDTFMPLGWDFKTLDLADTGNDISRLLETMVSWAEQALDL